MKAKIRSWALFVGAILLIALLIPVRKRISSINMEGIYPNAYKATAPGFMYEGGPYGQPHNMVIDTVKTEHGSINAGIEFDDIRFFTRNRYRPWKIATTTQPMGDESFFASDDFGGTLTLVYQRHNLTVCFENIRRRSDPSSKRQHERVLSPTADEKTELEQLARCLDNSISKGRPNVTIEHVFLGEIVWYKAQSSVCGLYFLITMFFHGPM